MAFMKRSSWAEKLAMLTAKLQDAEKRIAGLEAQLRQCVVDAELGDSAAQHRADSIQADLEAQHAAVGRLRSAVSEAKAEVTKEREAAEAGAAAERLASIPVLRDQVLRSAKVVQDGAEQLAAAMRTYYSDGQALAAALGSDNARRIFSLPAFVERLHVGLANIFTMELPTTPGHLAPSAPRVAFIEFRGVERDPRVKRSLTEEAAVACADVVPPRIEAPAA